MREGLATILSAFSAPVPGARGALPPRPAPTAPALGAKMREETGRALEQALTQGSADAFSHFGFHKAAEAMFSGGIRSMPTSAPRAPAPTAHAAPAAPVPQAPAHKAGPGLLRRAAVPLGLAGAGALGAAALAAHHESEEERAQRQLVYAPLGGYV